LRRLFAFLLANECNGDVTPTDRNLTLASYNLTSMTMLSELAARYWYVGGIAVSLIWFVAGKQSLSNKRPDAAIGWQAIAVIIALIVSGRSIVEKQWLGLALGVIAVFLEVRSIRRSTLARLGQ
jgi:hypothetical protein